MSRIALDRVVKRYGDVTAVDAVDLRVAEGEFLTLLGPSGCGKTTTLRLIAGFAEPTSGHILFDGEDITHVPPQKRIIGMVFQEYALFPHLTIEENIGFALRERGASRARIRARVGELLELIRLPGIERRYPAQLSGGQQQRVALARAIAHTPRVLLMDEPLGALDLKLREAMQVELRHIQRVLKITTVYVTHDQAEAMSLSDRIAVMNLGQIVQVGTPEEIYCQPRTTFVAQFVGKVNFIRGRVVDDDGVWSVVETAGRRLRVPKRPASDPGRDVTVTVAVRPESLQLVKLGSESPDHNALPGTVTSRRFVGNLAYVSVQIGGELSFTVEVRPNERVPASGEHALVTWAPPEGSVLRE